MEYEEIKGNLIALTVEGKFDVITHGCNCFCAMGSGIAPQMARAFGADKFDLEQPEYKGDKSKLGKIDWRSVNGTYIVNSYTQYGFSAYKKTGIPLDYEALRKCLQEINKSFNNQRIGLPLIGCGLAGGDWNIVKAMIQEELKDMSKITVVIYNQI